MAVAVVQYHRHRLLGRAIRAVDHEGHRGHLGPTVVAVVVDLGPAVTVGILALQ